MSALDLTPRPGAAPLPRMVAAQARLELGLLLRNGEQLLLLLVVPVLVLLLGATLDVLPGEGGVDRLAPGVLALAVLSTAFTGQAIATGFDRRYGVLKRLGATPLPRAGLLAAKALAVLAVEVLQVAVLTALGLALGWRPTAGAAGWLAAGALVLLATVALTALALLMAGTLRAEATLALANLVYLLLLVGGDVVVPLASLPAPVAQVLALTPLAALADGLRAALSAGGTGGEVLAAAAVLAVWGAVGGALAARFFRWE